MSRQGRTTAYGIPPRTSEVIGERTYRMLTFGSTAPKWTVVAFSVPEQDRTLRNNLRSRPLRFAALYDGVWVSPHDLGEEALGVVRELGITTATVLRSAEVPGTPAAGTPAAAFDLEPLAEEYREFADRYEPLLQSLDDGLIGPKQALRTRTELRVDWRHFPETDPDLPAELLPRGWDRARAQRVFVQIYDRLGPLAEIRFRQILGRCRRSWPSTPPTTTPRPSRSSSRRSESAAPTATRPSSKPPRRGASRRPRAAAASRHPQGGPSG
ncbi:phenylacetic acid degradation operon negative regulatory protein [Amycolatopsis thermophila]|uniref:Phenylacetic acid degradation operon negative regulatory protein n=1 Tax=Amycolatopsis thermophila TaxID=206084 RepID=A0ABU0F151_9PSEU|nr:phenylacetic acid degradation operon negative regulatory protein [Amycolatopsis thermophila]